LLFIGRVDLIQICCQRTDPVQILFIQPGRSRKIDFPGRGAAQSGFHEVERLDDIAGVAKVLTEIGFHFQAGESSCREQNQQDCSPQYEARITLGPQADFFEDAFQPLLGGMFEGRTEISE